MHHIKTAISIDQELFLQLDQLAHNMQVSRSHLLSQALAEYLDRRRNGEMLAQINDAYADGLDDAEQDVLQHATRQHRRIVREAS
jgi:predicted transcriptional regulator